MWTGADGQLPLPWLAPAVQAASTQWRGHALLLHGSAGNGALELALAIVQGALCEGGGSAQHPGGGCGRCDSCRLLPARAHPDLLLLMPEAMREERQWPLAIDKPDAGEREAGRRKASRQIRIDEVRHALDWVVSTSSRGRGKWLVLHPADALNPHAASALLKTLEEPPAGVRLVLTSGDPAALLPTIRSRCRLWRMPQPERRQQLDWLAAAGVVDADVLLDAAGGEALRALQLHAGGLRGAAWNGLPQAVARGDGALLSGLGAPLAIDALLRLCHDLQRRACGGAGLYFAAASLPPPGALEPLQRWQQELNRVARHAEHPWQEALLIDALLLGARRAMAQSAASARSAADAAPAAPVRAATLAP